MRIILSNLLFIVICLSGYSQSFHKMIHIFEIQPITVMQKIMRSCK
jgi:hypothetical protein